MTLEDRQIIFCEEYLKGLTATKKVFAYEAYLKAYPEVSKDSAMSETSRLLTHVKIKEYIANRMSEMAMGTNEVLIRLADIARSADSNKDKLAALELIGRTQAMFLDRQDITSAGQSISLADYLNGIQKATIKNGAVTVVKPDDR